MTHKLSALMARMPFGKHEGKPIEQVPRDYLRWVLLNVKVLEPPLREAITNRLRSGVPAVKAVDLRPRRNAGGGRLEAIRTANSLRDKIRDVFREKLIEYRFDSEDSYLALTAIEELQESVEKVIAEHLGSA